MWLNVANSCAVYYTKQQNERMKIKNTLHARLEQEVGMGLFATNHYFENCNNVEVLE